MKMVSKIRKRQMIKLALILALLGIAASAFAIPPNQFLRQGDNPSFTGKCCFSFEESVTVTEPAQVSPVVVTWSGDYRSNDVITLGIAVNGHPCQVPDLTNLDSSGSNFRSRMIQWIVLPGDGLIKGSNTIMLCGGGSNGTDTITLGFRTLLVTISK
jgi:hypothetical protein